MSHPAADAFGDLKRTAKQLRHMARLAAMALEGNDPEMGVEYLRDALALLREELRHATPPPGVMRMFVAFAPLAASLARHAA